MCALSGCVPVAVSIASYGFSGLSMVATGKGMGDLALSQATDRDCASWRIIKGDDICRDYTPQERHDRALAQLEADNYAAGYSHVSELSAPPVPLRPESVLIAELDAREAKDRALVKAEPEKAPPPAAPAPAPAPSVKATPGAVGTVTSVALASPPAAAPSAKKPSAAAEPKLIAVIPPAPLPARELKAVAGDNSYIVLGSYSTRARAAAGLAHYAALRPLLSVAKVGSKEVYRVVSGPYRPNTLAGARASLARDYALRDSWSIPSCVGAAGPNCAVAKALDTQIAALPPGRN